MCQSYLVFIFYQVEIVGDHAPIPIVYPITPLCCILIKVDGGVGGVFDCGTLYGLDAIQSVVGQILVFIMEGEQEPTLVVFF
jgi:hypothetical protein